MRLEIDSYQLKSNADRMMVQLEKVRTSMERMNDAIGVLNGMWEGAAKSAFLAQYSSDYENMTEVCNLVAKIIDGMNKAAVQYSQCNKEASDIVHSLKI